MATITVMYTANPKARAGMPRRIACRNLTAALAEASGLVMAAMADGWTILTGDGGEFTRLGNGPRRLDIAVKVG